MKKSLDELIQFRIQRSKDSLEEAKVLAQVNHWNGVINRLYYASFYIVSALLLRKGIHTKTHSGLKNRFSEEK